jgi:hypothetical protein
MGGVYSVLNQKRGMVFEEMQRPGEYGGTVLDLCACPSPSSSLYT